MCGIVGGISKENVVPVIINGLSKLEYRGYDSVGIAVINNGKLIRERTTSRVADLLKEVKKVGISSPICIGHTRWATHGEVNVTNAHPHFSNEEIAVIHNGIIENYLEIKAKLIKQNYEFVSETDTEAVAHLVHFYFQEHKNLQVAVNLACKELVGSYAIGVMEKSNHNELICVRLGSPMVLGIGNNGMYFASDVSALLSVTKRVIYLEDNDLARLTSTEYSIFDANNNHVERKIQISELADDSSSLGEYQHYMQKEIFEQEEVASSILANLGNSLNPNNFGSNAEEIFKSINKIQIISCGTSYLAGSIAKYWLEEITGLDVSVDIASEYRYRAVAVNKNALVINISQSGETADTISSVKYAKSLGMQNSLAICNVPESSLVRLSALHILTKAGLEIGVASTKAFTAQLIVLLYLSYTIAKCKNLLSKSEEQQYMQELASIPELIKQVLQIAGSIKTVAEELTNKTSALFLGRHVLSSIAQEGALKLKEISYIHAEGYAAGELKHGPIALIDQNMPVIALMSKQLLFDKMHSNIEEVLTRKGQVYLFTDCDDEVNQKCHKTIKLPIPATTSPKILPVLYIIPLQLLAYYTALNKNCDIDKPRNLAKSVTVE